MASEWWVKESLVKFNSPTCILMVGGSGSGKTYLTRQILENADGMFEDPPSNMFICYSAWQKAYDEMKNNTKTLTFHHMLPDGDRLQDWSSMDGHKIIVIDDLLIDGCDNTDLLKMFCIGSHHNNVTIIFLVQNIFHKGKVMRTLSLQCHYIILFKNRRDESQVEALGRQIFPRQMAYFRQSYSIATKSRYSYLLIDLCPHTPRVNITSELNELSPHRTCILPGEDTIVFIPKNYERII